MEEEEVVVYDDWMTLRSVSTYQMAATDGCLPERLTVGDHSFIADDVTIGR